MPAVSSGAYIIAASLARSEKYPMMFTRGRNFPSLHAGVWGADELNTRDHGIWSMEPIVGILAYCHCSWAGLKLQSCRMQGLRACRKITERVAEARRSQVPL